MLSLSCFIHQWVHLDLILCSILISKFSWFLFSSFLSRIFLGYFRNLKTRGICLRDWKTKNRLKKKLSLRRTIILSAVPLKLHFRAPQVQVNLMHSRSNNGKYLLALRLSGFRLGSDRSLPNTADFHQTSTLCEVFFGWPSSSQPLKWY